MWVPPGEGLEVVAKTSWCAAAYSSTIAERLTQGERDGGLAALN
jgi:hypothetical protein